MLGGWFTAPRPARVANAFARRSVGIHKSGAPFPGRHPKAMATHDLVARRRAQSRRRSIARPSNPPPINTSVIPPSGR